MSGAVTHAVWYFATNRDALPSRATTAEATSLTAVGHRRARTH